VVELKIDPEFRDKIPPLTDAEFEQLRENILADGEVYEPIATWNNVIVDGHNRWRIIQENPHIPFRTKEMEFANKWEAFDWMYRKQLGRRNLSDEQKTYMIGKMYEARKNSHGNNAQRGEDGKYLSSQSGNTGKSRGRIGEIIAKELGVGHGTVTRAADFAKGVDEMSKESPEAAKKILDGKSGATQADVRSFPTMTPEAKSEFISDVVSGAIKEKRKGYTKEDRKNRAETEAIVAEMFDTSSIKEMTVEDLVDEIKLNASEYIKSLRNTLADNSTLLSKENKPIIAQTIQTHIIDELIKMKGIVER
jgi:hypothetical protein